MTVVPTPLKVTHAAECSSKAPTLSLQMDTVVLGSLTVGGYDVAATLALLSSFVSPPPPMPPPPMSPHGPATVLTTDGATCAAGLEITTAAECTTAIATANTQAGTTSLGTVSTVSYSNQSKGCSTACHGPAGKYFCGSFNTHATGSGTGTGASDGGDLSACTGSGCNYIYCRTWVSQAPSGADYHYMGAHLIGDGGAGHSYFARCQFGPAGTVAPSSREACEAKCEAAPNCIAYSFHPAHCALHITGVSGDTFDCSSVGAPGAHYITNTAVLGSCGDLKVRTSYYGGGNTPYESYRKCIL